MHAPGDSAKPQKTLQSHVGVAGARQGQDLGVQGAFLGVIRGFTPPPQSYRAAFGPKNWNWARRAPNNQNKVVGPVIL